MQFGYTVLRTLPELQQLYLERSVSNPEFLLETGRYQFHQASLLAHHFSPLCRTAAAERLLDLHPWTRLDHPLTYSNLST